MRRWLRLSHEGFGRHLHNMYKDKHLDWEIVLPGAEIPTKNKSVFSYCIMSSNISCVHSNKDRLKWLQQVFKRSFYLFEVKDDFALKTN